MQPVVASFIDLHKKKEHETAKGSTGPKQANQRLSATLKKFRPG